MEDGKMIRLLGLAVVAFLCVLAVVVTFGWRP